MLFLAFPMQGIRPEESWRTMEILLSQPRGFCAGVIRAIEIADTSQMPGA